MKDFMSKEHYCYKIYTLLMKRSVYLPPPFFRQPPLYRLSLPPPFLHNDLELPDSMIFQKSKPHWGSHYEDTLGSICAHIYE